MSLTIFEEAMRDAKENARHGESRLLGFLRALAQDSSCYESETGDSSDFGSWACLFLFDEDEATQLIRNDLVGTVEELDRLTEEQMRELGAPNPSEARYALALRIDDAGFAGIESFAGFQEMEREYTAFCDSNGDE